MFLFSFSVLGHIAIPYYEKVLEMEPTGDNAEQKKVSICPFLPITLSSDYLSFKLLLILTLSNLASPIVLAQYTRY